MFSVHRSDWVKGEDAGASKAFEDLETASVYAAECIARDPETPYSVFTELDLGEGRASLLELVGQGPDGPIWDEVYYFNYVNLQ